MKQPVSTVLLSPYTRDKLLGGTELLADVRFKFLRRISFLSCEFEWEPFQLGRAPGCLVIRRCRMFTVNEQTAMKEPVKEVTV
jgi:hypothetical protein